MVVAMAPLAAPVPGEEAKVGRRRGGRGGRHFAVGDHGHVVGPPEGQGAFDVGEPTPNRDIFVGLWLTQLPRQA